MTWGELKAQLESGLSATTEWLKETASTIDQWIIETASTAYAWIEELVLIVYQWLTRIATMVQQGDTDSLPIDEILLAIPIALFSAYLGYRLLLGLVSLLIWMSRRIDVAAHRLAGMPPPLHKAKKVASLDPSRRKQVLHEGRWTIHGYEDSFKAEHRRRNWRKKLMTPREQQKYVDKVQEKEHKKKPKRNSGKFDIEEVREEAKRRL